jgi:hypothetical protein
MFPLPKKLPANTKVLVVGVEAVEAVEAAEAEKGNPVFNLTKNTLLN